MAEVLLFHSAHGLTSGVRDFAVELELARWCRSCAWR